MIRYDAKGLCYELEENDELVQFIFNNDGEVVADKQEDTYRGDGLNRYAYCRNNPVYYVDPTGHDSSKANSYEVARDYTNLTDEELPQGANCKGNIYRNVGSSVYVRC